MALEAQTLYPGCAEGALLPLRAPLSFWGGVDRDTGRVANPRHPDYGAALGGRVVYIRALIGSSSSAAVLLELIDNGSAPAAIVLADVDAILVMGCLAAREIDLTPPPVLLCRRFPDWAPETPLCIKAPAAGAPAVIKTLAGSTPPG